MDRHDGRWSRIVGSGLIERLLVSTERHIADGERHIAQQHEIIDRLEGTGLGSCATASMARDLLQQMETSLDRRLLERERLRDCLKRAADYPTTPLAQRE
jgi:hypothetical protein